MNISCIIPTCNRNAYLREAVDAVLGQTSAPFEVIIVQNGTEPIVLPDAMMSRVRILEIEPRSGAARARNAGVEVARGDYVAFLDDDDLWSPNYLERVGMAFTEGHDCVVSRLDKLEHGAVSVLKQMTESATIDDLLIYNPGITGSNIALSKSAFSRAGGFDPSLIVSEDKALIIELMRLGMRVRTLTDNYAIIRIHDGERLTQSTKFAAGMLPFLKKYRPMMRSEQYFFNLVKMHRYAYQGGKKTAAVSWLYAKALHTISKSLS